MMMSEMDYKHSDKLLSHIRRDGLSLNTQEFMELYGVMRCSKKLHLSETNNEYLNYLYSLSLKERLTLLHKSIVNNRERVDLINNVIYQGVCDHSMVVSCYASAVNCCSFTLFEDREFRYDSQENVFELILIYNCLMRVFIRSDFQFVKPTTTNLGYWKFKNSRIKNVYKSDYSCWLCTFGPLNSNLRFSSIQAIIDYFTEECKTYMSENSLLGRVCNTCICAKNRLSNEPIPHKNRFNGCLPKLQELSSFFILNFFYNDKLLIKSILPQHIFNSLEDLACRYTHRWRN
jgi:hypothetical protein